MMSTAVFNYVIPIGYTRISMDGRWHLFSLPIETLPIIHMHLHSIITIAISKTLRNL